MIRFALRVGVALTACGALAGAAQAAGDPAAGKAKFETCTGCHSIPGYTNAYPTYRVPRLGGQHPDYIVSALKAYQSGERQHPTMHANSSSLSEQDIQNIAAYLASSATATFADDPNPVRGNIGAGKKKSVACVACHGPDGNGPIPLYPRLAGQHEDYLVKVLQDYKSGKRNNAVMKGIVLPLTEQDIVDLAAYFASQPKGVVVMGQD
ncbi:MAG: cytochrome c [Candidatus Competibacteraceae bacterium]|nr:cytochrome c [Candidatus Competibacteraceae bacterium]